MSKTLRFALFLSAIFLLNSCYRCYECKVDTDFGEVTRDVCGRKKDISGLVQALETDTTGNGPWTCE